MYDSKILFEFKQNKKLIKKGVVMKTEKIKTKLFMSLSVLIVSFLISTSFLSIVSTKALLEEEYYLYRTDSFDRSAWIWSPTEVVSTESTGNSYNPSLAVDTLGNVHVAWDDLTDYLESGTDEDIFYKVFAEPPIIPEFTIITGILLFTVLATCIVVNFRRRKMNNH